MYQNSSQNHCQTVTDFGPEPLIIDMNRAAGSNPYFRTALWTGCHLQVTLMCIPVGGDIGLEVHEDTDQFIRIEQGCGMVCFGESRSAARNIRHISCHDAVMIPAGTWHNITNCANVPLKLYSIYAPPHHPFGTIHRTKESAQQSESSYNNCYE